MNETIETILKRRSTRSFQQKKVPEENIELILKCALSAPSGMNNQKWLFTAVNNREKIQSLARAVGKALGRDESYNMYSPEVLIICSNEKDNKFKEVDNACAMENIYIASTALGLGCVWINQLKDCFDTLEVRKHLNDLGIPENHGVFGCAAIGYPADGSAHPKEIHGKYLIIN